MLKACSLARTSRKIRKAKPVNTCCAVPENCMTLSPVWNMRMVMVPTTMPTASLDQRAMNLPRNMGKQLVITAELLEKPSSASMEPLKAASNTPERDTSPPAMA